VELYSRRDGGWARYSACTGPCTHTPCRLSQQDATSVGPSPRTRWRSSVAPRRQPDRVGLGLHSSCVPLAHPANTFEEGITSLPSKAGCLPGRVRTVENCARFYRSINCSCADMLAEYKPVATADPDDDDDVIEVVAVSSRESRNAAALNRPRFRWGLL